MMRTYKGDMSGTGSLYMPRSAFHRIQITRPPWNRPLLHEARLENYPPFFALIAATVCVSVFSSQTISLAGLGSEGLFLRSYANGMWNHTWLLAVEAHFYLLLPLMLALILYWNRASPTPCVQSSK